MPASPVQVPGEGPPTITYSISGCAHSAGLGVPRSQAARIERTSSTITGGNGMTGVRDFYGHHFIGQWPDDTETRQVSRTVGENQIVDELVMTFTHDRQLDIMLPGIPPTGRRITVPVVVVVGFEGNKVSHEHIYWDHATVLVQAGLLDPSGLPVVGVEEAEALLDQRRPKNELFGSGA